MALCNHPKCSMLWEADKGYRITCDTCGLTSAWSKDQLAAFQSLGFAGLGRIGGKVKSEAKARAARENGKKGGRPRAVEN